MNHQRLRINSKDRKGIAFGEAVLMSSPSSRSQMDTRPESGSGGWADEMIRRAPEAAPLLSQRNASTTFDNISHS